MADITFNHVTKRYDDGTEAVKDFNLEIGDGEFMILVGPSGCGKSTALRMIAGLEDISDGELKIGGDVVNDRAPKDRDIAMVFQNYALYPHMTVRENMGFALKLAKTPKEELTKKVEDAARILDLTDHLDRKPANLSGGQRQRVAMGRAIVRDPSAFLMDEPLSNLDAKLRVQMRTEISRIQQRLGTTTVYVTHDQTEAMTLGDRVAVMRGGVLQQVGSPGELYDNPVNLFVAGFIGSPSMNFMPATLEGDTVHLPFGDVRLTDAQRRSVEAAGAESGGEQPVIAGVRPEDFEDAEIAGGDRHPPGAPRPPHERPDDRGGVTFDANIDVVESMGSEIYAYFSLEGEAAKSEQLAELEQDAGLIDVPSRGEAAQVIARLDPQSGVREGQSAKLWLDTTRIHLFDPDEGRNLLRGQEARDMGGAAGRDGNGAGGSTESPEPESPEPEPEPAARAEPAAGEPDSAGDERSAT